MKPNVEMYRERRFGEIALCLRMARLRAGWTQEQVAEHLGYSRAHVNRVEQGASAFGLPELELIASAFNVTLPELLENK